MIRAEPAVAGRGFSRAWTNRIREQAWDAESQAYDVRFVYQYIRESLDAMNRDPQAFRASLKQRSG